MGRMIDADDFENRMYNEVFEKDSEDQKWDSGCWMRYKLFERVLKEQPTIEPERKKGKWLPDNNNYYDERYVCSECKVSYKVDTCMGHPSWDFCPNCGADMRGDSNESD